MAIMSALFARAALINLSAGTSVPRSIILNPAPSSIMHTKSLPISWLSPTTVPTTIIPIGWAYAEKGEYDRAITDFTSLINMNPDSGEAYYSRGEVYTDKGDYDKAIADFTRDIELGDIYCHFARGLAYAKIGNKSEAIADFDVIVRLSGDPELIPKAKQEIERLQT